MAGTTTAMCTSFKAELMQALHNFTASTGNTFKMSLVKSGPTNTYDGTITNAGTPGSGAPVQGTNIGTDETSGTGYSAGGTSLTNVTPTTSGTTAYTNFSPNPSWSSATFSTIGCVIYNNTNSNRAVSVHDFGGTQSVSGGTFTVLMPTAAPGTAILQIS